ncbi:MAG: tetratricopeptide repeat protein [Candidatus Theseobacter exili]|nr:tetratricopeptide repeat protein [Candidatus Theseobacter exili]
MKYSHTLFLATIVIMSIVSSPCLYAKDTKQMLDKAMNLSISGNDEQALEVYEKIIKIDPENAEAYNHIGTIYYNEAVENRDIELLKKAIEKFKKALSLNNSYGEAHDNLAMCYVITREDNKARSHYQKAKSLGIRNERLEKRFYGK